MNLEREQTQCLSIWWKDVGLCEAEGWTLMQMYLRRRNTIRSNPWWWLLMHKYGFSKISKYHHRSPKLRTNCKTAMRNIWESICLANDAVGKGTSHFKGNDFQITGLPATEGRSSQMEIDAASNSEPPSYTEIIDGFLPKCTNFPSQSPEIASGLSRLRRLLLWGWVTKQEIYSYFNRLDG